MSQERKPIRPIPLIADIPSDVPGFGFGEYADALTAAVIGGSPPRFTVGLYGPWGSGKSSLLQAIFERLDKDPTVIPVQFDAWRYERSEHIVIPLLHGIHEAISGRGDSRCLTRSGGRWVRSFSA